MREQKRGIREIKFFFFRRLACRSRSRFWAIGWARDLPEPGTVLLP